MTTQVPRTAHATRTAHVTRAALVLVAVLALAAGCGVPRRPAWWASPTGTAPGPVSPTVAPSPTPTPAWPVVTRPWQPGEPQLGIDIYWERTPTDPISYVQGKADRVLDYIVSLGANAVSFSIPLYTDGLTSNNVYAGDHTPTPAQVSLVVRAAADRGLRVTLRPILDERVLVAQDPDAWRGSIEPTDPSQWLRAYQSTILPYASLDDRDLVSTFVVGTELESMEGDPGWPSVVAALRSTFPGELTYSMNSGRFLHSPDYAPVSAITLDAYPSMPLDDDASVADLAAGWRNWLAQARPDLLSGLVLSEVGIAAQDGAYRHPAVWGSSDVPLNLTVQDHWYRAACQAAQELRLGGIYWWHLNFDLDPASGQPPSDDRMAFTPRPAEQAIRDCFATWR